MIVVNWPLIIQAIGSIATPLIVLAFGIVISRQLEKSKLSLSKEKEWQTKWADGFFSRAVAFNDAVEDYVLLFWEFGQLSLQTDEQSAIKIKEKNEFINVATEKLIRAEWLLKSHVVFAPIHGSDVLAKATDVMKLVRKLRDEKRGNLDDIRESLAPFNIAAKNAHHEMLAP